MKGYHNSTTKFKDRDYWETPDYLYNWIDKRYGIEIDLACTSENCKAANGFYADKDWNAFDYEWGKLANVGFCNPPYSDIDPWLNKALNERDMYDFTTVFVIPMPNGERRDSMIFQADRLWFIRDRISFIHADIKKVGPGNTRGTIIAVYGGWDRGVSCIDRQTIIDETVTSV